MADKLETYLLKGLKSLKVYNIKDLNGDKDIYFEPRFIRYMSFAGMTEKDLSFIIVTYNLYHYVKNKKISLLQKDSSNLERGCDTLAISVNYKDMLDIQSTNGVDAQLVSKIRDILGNVKNVGLKGCTLHGSNNKPKVSDKLLGNTWGKYLNNNIYSQLDKLIVEDNLSDIVHNNKDKDNFKLAVVIQDKDLVYQEKKWFVLYTIKAYATDTGELLTTRPIYLDAKFSHIQDDCKDIMKKVLNKVEDNHFKEVKEYDNQYLHSISYKKQDTKKSNITADNEQTIFVLDRVKTVLENNQELITSAKYDKKINGLHVEFRNKEWKETAQVFVFGGNGFSTNNCLYTRSSSDDDSNRKKALSTLNKVVGNHPIWQELLDCYDFRKNIEKGV